MRSSRVVLLCASLSTAACGYSQRDAGGTVRVSLEAAAEGAWFEETTAAVHLSPGDYAKFWEAQARGRHYQTKESPAVFRGVTTTSARQVVLPGRFIYEPVSVWALPDEAVEVRIPVLLRTGHLRPTTWRDVEKVLYIDVASVPDAWLVGWRKAGVKLNEQRVVRDLEALVPLLTDEHHVHGSHRDVSDHRFDQAIIVAPAEATLDELSPVVKALGRVTTKRRDYRKDVEVPAFQVRVAHPEDLVIHAPESAPSRASTYEGPEPSIVLRTPEWMDGTTQHRVLQAARPSIADCYKHTLSNNPGFEKRFEVELDVDADGRVPGARVPLEAQRDRLSHCTVEALRKLRFEGVKHGHTLTIGVTLSLSGVGR